MRIWLVRRTKKNTLDGAKSSHTRRLGDLPGSVISITMAPVSDPFCSSAETNSPREDTLNIWSDWQPSCSHQTSPTKYRLPSLPSKPAISLASLYKCFTRSVLALVMRTILAGRSNRPVAGAESRRENISLDSPSTQTSSAQSFPPIQIGSNQSAMGGRLVTLAGSRTVTSRSPRTRKS